MESSTHQFSNILPTNLLTTLISYVYSGLIWRCLVQSTCLFHSSFKLYFHANINNEAEAMYKYWILKYGSKPKKSKRLCWNAASFFIIEEQELQ